MLHFVSFAVLTLLARLAYPQAGTRVVFVALCALGAGIEFIQAHPALPRDASFTDWLADLLAISLVCALMSSWNWDSAP